MPFTDRQVSALRPRKSRFEIPEPGRTGLAIRVSPNGVKSWAFRYRFHGHQKRMIFGTYPTISLVDARVKLVAAQKDLQEGRDPGAIAHEQKLTRRAAATMGDLIQEYLTRHAEKTLRASTLKEEQRILKKEILPFWRNRLAQDITRRDIITLLNAIEDRGVYVLRNRVAGVFSRLFMFGLNVGIINGSPAQRLPMLRKVGDKRVEEPRSRFLTKDEIRSFWVNLDHIPITPQLRLALKWTLVTGQRRSEVAGTLRAEIDSTDLVWKIPTHRAKNKREHILPLPSIAKVLLQQVDAANVRKPPTRLNRKDRHPFDATPSPWLFPSRQYSKSITAGALTCAVVRHRKALAIGDATLHDLRRSVASWLGELGVEKSLISALLNHSPQSVTERHYDKSTLLGPKREAMERWGSWLEAVISGKSVQDQIAPPTKTFRVV